MPIRFRKSIKLADGIKLNLGKKSAWVTVGNKLFRQTFNTSGRKTTSASVPGTGISIMNTNQKKKKVKAAKVKKPVVEEFEEVTVPKVASEPLVEEPVDFDNAIGNGPEGKSRKMKIWPWVIMAVVLLSVLVALFNQDSPEVSEKSGTEAVTQIATTTQFTYAAEDVSLKLHNGVLTAFVGEKMVPYSGLANAEDGTYVVKDGVADTTLTGVYNDNGALKLVKDGKVDTTSSGVVKAGDGNWYYTEAGVVATAYTGVKKNEYGRWYVKDGKVDFGYSGDVMSDGSTYVIKGGKVDTTQNGVMKVGGRWAYVTDGMINTNYTGVKSNENGTWYIKNGYVDFGYSGTVDAPDGNKYDVNGGRASKVVPTTTASYESYDNNDASDNITYIGNRNTKTFHYDGCRALSRMKESNRVTGNRSYFESRNYKPCQICNP